MRIEPAFTSLIVSSVQLLQLRAEVSIPVQVFCDSKTAIQIEAHPVIHERTKYIHIERHSATVKETLQLITLVPKNS